MLAPVTCTVTFKFYVSSNYPCFVSLFPFLPQKYEFTDRTHMTHVNAHMQDLFTCIKRKCIRRPKWHLQDDFSLNYVDGLDIWVPSVW